MLGSNQPSRKFRITCKYRLIKLHESLIVATTRKDKTRTSATECVHICTPFSPQNYSIFEKSTISPHNLNQKCNKTDVTTFTQVHIKFLDQFFNLCAKWCASSLYSSTHTMRSLTRFFFQVK